MLPREDRYGVQLRDEIPPGSDVPCNEYAEGEDGERVHGSPKACDLRSDAVMGQMGARKAKSATQR